MKRYLKLTCLIIVQLAVLLLGIWVAAEILLFGFLFFPNVIEIVGARLSSDIGAIYNDFLATGPLAYLVGFLALSLYILYQVVAVMEKVEKKIKIVAQPGKGGG